MHEKVIVYGLAYASMNVHVYCAVRTCTAEMHLESNDWSEDTYEGARHQSLEFPFQSIGIFVAGKTSNGLKRYFDAAPLYEGIFLRSRSDISIQTIHEKWMMNYMRWKDRYPQRDHLPFVTLNDFYPVWHSFVKSSVSSLFPFNMMCFA